MPARHGVVRIRVHPQYQLMFNNPYTCARYCHLHYAVTRNMYSLVFRSGSFVSRSLVSCLPEVAQRGLQREDEIV